MNARPFSCRSLPVLALVVAGLAAVVPLLAAEAPATAPGTAALPATEPAAAETVYMWNFVRAGVVNGQLMLIPARSEPIDTREITNVAGVPGTVHVHTYLREVLAYAYRVQTDGKMKHTQTALLQRSEFRLADVVRNTETNAVDNVFYHDVSGPVPGFPAPAARITLTVSKTDNSTDIKAGTDIVKLEAASFAELCAKHPEEVKKYVAPILQDMDLAGVFFVDLKDAQHVFAGHAPPDPAVTAKVQAILPRLDDESPEVRQAAARDLAALGDAGVAPVQAIDLSRLPLQTRSMLKTFLESASVEDPRLLNEDFLLQCIALDDKQLPALAKARLEKLRGKPVDVDSAAPLEERRKVVLKMLMGGWAAALPAPPQK